MINPIINPKNKSDFSGFLYTYSRLDKTFTNQNQTTWGQYQVIFALSCSIGQIITNKKELKLKLFPGLEDLLKPKNWNWSHWRESNPRPRPYHGRALPLSHSGVKIWKTSNFFVRKIYFLVTYISVNSRRKNFSSANFLFLSFLSPKQARLLYNQA